MTPHIGWLASEQSCERQLRKCGGEPSHVPVALLGAPLAVSGGFP